jgi:formamidopyrimidine-DNA glycosylase
MSDRSLDEFLGSDDADADATDADAAAEASGAEESETESTEGGDSVRGDREGNGGETDDDVVEPATSTYVRKPAGTPCEACGESVERQWESDAGLVCPDCKEW